MPSSPLRLILLIAAFAVLVTFVQIGVLRVAFDRLGLSQDSAYLLLMTTLIGSLINVPLFTVEANLPSAAMLPRPLRGLFGMPRSPFTGKTVVAVNVGGCVTPAAFSIYLLLHNPLNPLLVLLAVAAVTIVAYLTSYPVAGMGIAMPFLVAPVTAALVAVMLDPEHRALLGYIGGTLGVLIGADLLRLKEIPKLGAPLASIGGAGTFDGIFLTGILAVLLA